LIAAYKELEDRTVTITSGRGIKGEMVLQAIDRLPSEFTIGDLNNFCHNVSRDMIRAILNNLKVEGKAKCQGIIALSKNDPPMLR